MARVLFLLVLIAVLGLIHAEWVHMEPSVNTFSSRNWLKEKTVNPYDSVKAIFVLKHDESTVKEMHNRLMDTSNPKSINYGKWMSVSIQ